jgi:hypothetical protein
MSEGSEEELSDQTPIDFTAKLAEKIPPQKIAFLLAGILMDTSDPKLQELSDKYGEYLMYADESPELEDTIKMIKAELNQAGVDTSPQALNQKLAEIDEEARKAFAQSDQELSSPFTHAADVKKYEEVASTVNKNFKNGSGKTGVLVNIEAARAKRKV